MANCQTTCMFQLDVNDAATARASGPCASQGGWYRLSHLSTALLAPLMARRGAAVVRPACVQERLEGVTRDLARAVSAGDITLDQARRFHQRLRSHIGA